MTIDWDRLRDRTDYSVIVYDNFHHANAEEAYAIFGFADAETALSHCKQMVDGCLQEAAEPGFDADMIYGRYTAFGDDPTVHSPRGAPEVRFSAWTYARENAGRFMIAASKGDAV